MGAKGSSYRHFRSVEGVKLETPWIERLKRQLKRGTMSKLDYEEAVLMFNRHKNRHNRFTYNIRIH